MTYVLENVNTTNGWIGPYVNEPGDSNGRLRRGPSVIITPPFSFICTIYVVTTNASDE
jgi:hypothetical protein